MTETIVFVTPSYLNFASREALERIKERVRTVLLIYRGDQVSEQLRPYFDEVVPLGAALNQNIRPVLDLDGIVDVARREIEWAGGRPEAVRIFCQEECNVLNAARARELLGIPGDTASMVTLFRDKLAMKRAISAHGVRVPRHQVLDQERLRSHPQPYFDELLRELGPRLVIKPTSAAGSFNVAIVESYADFLQARNTVLDEAYPFQYEVDEFIDGTMYQCDSFTRGGVVQFSGILELGCSNFDFVLGKPLSVYPALAPELRSRLFAFNQKVITALGLTDGCTHHELFVENGSGEIVFLEIAARVPGGIGVPFHARNSNINLIDAHLYLTCDEELLSLLRPDPRNNVVSALLPVGHGRVVQLNEPQIQSRYDIAWNIRVGARVNARSLVDNAGILTLYNDDPVTLRADFEKLQQYVPVVCAPEAAGSQLPA